MVPVSAVAAVAADIFEAVAVSAAAVISEAATDISAAVIVILDITTIGIILESALAVFMVQVFMVRAIITMGCTDTLTATDIGDLTTIHVYMAILQLPLFPGCDQFIFKEKFLLPLLRSNKPITGITAVIRKAIIPMLSNALKVGFK